MLSQICTVYVKASVSMGSGGTRTKFLTDANQLCVLLLFDMTFSLDEAHCREHCIKSNANHLNPSYTQILSSQTLCLQYLGSGRLQIRHYLDSMNVSASCFCTFQLSSELSSLLENLSNYCQKEPCFISLWKLSFVCPVFNNSSVSIAFCTIRLFALISKIFQSFVKTEYFIIFL